MDLIQLAQVKGQWQTTVGIVMSHQLQ